MFTWKNSLTYRLRRLRRCWCSIKDVDLLKKNVGHLKQRFSYNEIQVLFLPFLAKNLLMQLNLISTSFLKYFSDCSFWAWWWVWRNNGSSCINSNSGNIGKDAKIRKVIWNLYLQIHFCPRFSQRKYTSLLCYWSGL